MKKEIINKQTGEIHEAKLNEVIVIYSKRKNGSLRIQRDFSNCPTMAEQHTAHLTNLNYLIERYKPDELAAYIAARDQHRREILGHDFSKEPDLQGAKNVVYQSRKAFDELPDDLKQNFKNHVEFLKFIDNPANSEKMQKMGILTQAQLDKLKIEMSPPTTPTTTPTKNEEKETAKKQ